MVGLLTNHIGFYNSHWRDLDAKIQYDRLIFSKKQFAADQSNIKDPRVRFVSVSNWFLLTERLKILHCFSPLGLMVGGLLCLTSRYNGIRLVFTFTGQGYLFTESSKSVSFNSLKRWFLGRLYVFILRVLIFQLKPKCIFENSEDLMLCQKRFNLKNKDIYLIKGAGVDLKSYPVKPELEKKRQVLFPARLLKDKGIVEFKEAAAILKPQYPFWDFLLAGEADYPNPTSITKSQVMEWQSQGSVKWLGYVEDMAPLFMETAIVCLPSYREGMPKALLEAAAAGCAVVTTDVIGCREAIIPGETGDLVPVMDSVTLAKVIGELIEKPEKIEAYGRAGRSLARREYSIEKVVADTLSIYKEILMDGD